MDGFIIPFLKILCHISPDETAPDESDWRLHDLFCEILEEHPIHHLRHFLSCDGFIDSEVIIGSSLENVLQSEKIDVRSKFVGRWNIIVVFF